MPRDFLLASFLGANFLRMYSLSVLLLKFALLTNAAEISHQKKAGVELTAPFYPAHTKEDNGSPQDLNQTVQIATIIVTAIKNNAANSNMIGYITTFHSSP